MDELAKRVREFHVKHGYPLDVAMRKSTSQTLIHLGEWMIKQSVMLLELYKHEGCATCGDLRFYRAHLQLEEQGELFIAMGKADEVGVADGGGDMLVVTTGLLESFNLPTEFITQEIMDSNMSKQVRTPENFRMRDKGPDYRAPNLRFAIDNGRDMRRWAGKERVD